MIKTRRVSYYTRNNTTENKGEIRVISIIVLYVLLYKCRNVVEVNYFYLFFSMKDIFLMILILYTIFYLSIDIVRQYRYFHKILLGKED